jgi:hypothetical protein
MRRELARSAAGSRLASAFVLIVYLGPPWADASAQEPAAKTTSSSLDRKAEIAIEKGLNYLERTQNEEGSWGGENRIGITALALIAFMIDGNFPGEEPYGKCMEKGVDVLLKENKMGMKGYMGTNMYSHGLATLALSELWGQTDRDDEIREALRAAVDVILRAQSEAGGWRYDPVPSSADVSVTAMQLVALASARQAGILVPNTTIDRAIRFVKMCREETSGGFTYMAGRGDPAVARSAAAVFSLMMCGEHESRYVTDGIAYLMRTATQAELHYFCYAHYYLALVMYVSSEENHKKWRPIAQKTFLELQGEDGGFTHGGRGERDAAYRTAMSIIVLGIPKGFVPAYQR